MSACARCADRPGDPLCPRCLADLADALRDLPGLAVRAHRAMGARSRALSERVSSSRPGSRSPIRDDLLHLVDQLARALQEWWVSVSDDITQRPFRYSVRTGYHIQHATLALGKELPAALRPPALRHAMRVLALSKQLRIALGETPLIHSLAAPCPSCDTRALIRRDGADHVECRMCGAAWPESRYQLLTRALIAETTADNGEITSG